jgi:hypothetical protein
MVQAPRQTPSPAGFRITFIGSLFIITLFSKLIGFAAYCASSIHWSAFSHILVIVPYQHLVLVFCQIAYHAISFFSARHCFRVADGFGVLGSLLKCTFLHSIRTSAAHSLLLAVTGPVHFLAKQSVTDVVNTVQPINAPVARAV